MEMQGIGNILNSHTAKNNQLKNKIGGFTQIKNLLIDSTQFSIYEKMVLLVIKRHKGAKEYCWPSHKLIAKKARCSVSSVKEAIDTLVKKGVIEKKRGENVRSNEYRINNKGSPYA